MERLLSAGSKSEDESGAGSGFAIEAIRSMMGKTSEKSERLTSGDEWKKEMRVHGKPVSQCLMDEHYTEARVSTHRNQGSTASVLPDCRPH